MRLVITGGGGLVGRRLAEVAARRGHDVLALGSADCDIRDRAAASAHVVAGDVVVNCAAYTAVDKAESDEAQASAVNAEGAGNVARACAQVGAELVHMSTDYVFGGVFGGATSTTPYEIDDPTSPTSVYGRTKLAGEHAVLTALPGARVVRTSWIFSDGDDGDFVAVMRRLAAGTGPVDVVADQVGSPTYVADLVDALLEVVERPVNASILHAANGGAASRYEQAAAVFELVGADPQRVRPVTTDRFPRSAPRPAYSVLAAGRSAAAGLTPLRPWRDALAAALAV
jgi:dTDP-4-dehydrorhamnose reductase